MDMEESGPNSPLERGRESPREAVRMTVLVGPKSSLLPALLDTTWGFMQVVDVI